MRRFICLAASLTLQASVALAQDAPAEAENPVAKRHYTFHELFFDEQDGKLDVSNYLAKGGLVPIPIIITEPAVDQGLGFVAQFISWPDGTKDTLTRRMLGGARTGNGSYGYGYFQSGTVLDGRLNYKFGLGQGELTIAAYPGGLVIPVEYTTTFDYGVFGSVLWELPDSRFSIGPLIDIRKTETRLSLPASLPVIAPDLTRTLKTAALGIGLHFDNRDNPLTPTKGANVYLNAKFNDGTFGSDRDFQVYDLEGYYFGSFAPRWRYGARLAVNAVRGDTPFNVMPAIDTRGVPSNRYQGETILNTEFEVTRELGDRWSVLGFVAAGRADAGDSRFFKDSGFIYSGGAGLRYRIARKLGLDAGMDVAIGPEDTIVYFQFGHAWSRGMD